MKKNLIFLLPSLLWVVTAVPATVTITNKTNIPARPTIQFTDGTQQGVVVPYAIAVLGRLRAGKKTIDIGSKCVKSVSVAYPAGSLPTKTESVSRCGNQTEIEITHYDASGFGIKVNVK